MAGGRRPADRRLRRGGGRLLPGAGRRPARSAKPRAPPSCRRAGKRREPGGRHPRRRRRRTDAFPADRLEQGRRRRAVGRKPVEPCRHAGPLEGSADGGRPRGREVRRPQRSDRRRRGGHRRAQPRRPRALALRGAAGRDRRAPATGIRLPRQAGRDAGRTAHRSAGQHRLGRRARAPRGRQLRRHRAHAHRVPVPRRRTAPRRRDAISRLCPVPRVGAGAAGDHPDARHRRRQAGQAADAGRRTQSVSRHPGRPADAPPSRRVPNPAQGAGARRGARPAQGHGADGDDPRRARRDGTALRRGGRRARSAGQGVRRARRSA